MSGPAEGRVAKAPLAVGEVIEIRIDKAVFRGLGLARHEGRVIFVPRTYAGERVRARVTAVARGYANASLESLLEPSAIRRPAPCAHAALCGGCSYQDVRYEDQLGIKASVLRESLVRAGVPWDATIAVAPSPETAWRTRAELHLEWGDAGARLGFYAEGSHALVDVDECPQLSPGLNAAARALRAALDSHGPLARRVSSIELAESYEGGERVACLVTDLPAQQAAGLSSVAQALPEPAGLLALARGGNGAATPMTLRGEPYLHATVHGQRLRAHQQSFFQANRYLTERLVDAVLRCVTPGSPILDLYSGVGLFALATARRGDPVRGVELHPLAVADARANAAATGLPAASFDALDVEEALSRYPRPANERVILDPPRSGVARRALQRLAAREPQSLTYVSCDPPTLGRDVALLLRSGYRLASVEAFDMFPDTFHVEAVAHLVKTA